MATPRVIHPKQRRFRNLGNKLKNIFTRPAKRLETGPEGSKRLTKEEVFDKPARRSAEDFQRRVQGFESKAKVLGTVNEVAGEEAMALVEVFKRPFAEGREDAAQFIDQLYKLRKKPEQLKKAAADMRRVRLGTNA